MLKILPELSKTRIRSILGLYYDSIYSKFSLFLSLALILIKTGNLVVS